MKADANGFVRVRLAQIGGCVETAVQYAPLHVSHNPGVEPVKGPRVAFIKQGAYVIVGRIADQKDPGFVSKSTKRVVTLAI